MADIIDSLLVSLGLDRSEFEKGKKNTDRDLDDLADKAKKKGGNVEDATKKMGLAFAKLRGEVAALLLTFAGAKSLTSFATELVNATAAVGRASSTLSQPLNTLNAMGDAIRAAGGSAQEATAIAGRTSDIRANFIRHPDAVPSTLLNQLGLTRGSFDSMEGLQYALADRFQLEMKRAGNNPTAQADVRATFRQRVQELLGASDEWVTMLEKGTPALRQQIELFEKQDPVTEANAKAAQDLQASMEHLRASLAGAARNFGVVDSLNALAQILDVVDGSADKLGDDGRTLAAGFLAMLNPVDALILALNKAGIISNSTARGAIGSMSGLPIVGPLADLAISLAQGGGGAAPGAPGGPAGGGGGSVAGANYDSVVGHVTAARVSTMAMGDLIRYGREVLIPLTRQKGIGRDRYGRLLGSSAAGAYQITGSTIAQYAPQVFGADWRHRTFDAAAQDKLAEAIFNANKGGDLASIWTSLSNHHAGAYAAFTWSQMRGYLAAHEGGSINVKVEHPAGTVATVSHKTGRGTRRVLHGRAHVANANTGLG